MCTSQVLKDYEGKDLFMTLDSLGTIIISENLGHVVKAFIVQVSKCWRY